MTFSILNNINTSSSLIECNRKRYRTLCMSVKRNNNIITKKCLTCLFVRLLGRSVYYCVLCTGFVVFFSHSQAYLFIINKRLNFKCVLVSCLNASASVWYIDTLGKGIDCMNQQTNAQGIIWNLKITTISWTVLFCVLFYIP